MKSYKNALILGMGVSGRAAAELLLSEGSQVCVCDASDSPSLAETARMLQSKGAEVRLGPAALPHREFDVCVISPGIPLMSPWGIACQRLAKETLSELELAFSRCHLPVIAVTGTNGKSTCCKLITELLAFAGMRPMLGGNYGIPFCQLIQGQADHDWAVIEVSSFQLEAVTTFRPRVGVLLNIQPDHLTRHGSMQEYARLKARMFAFMGVGDTVVVPHELQHDVRALLQASPGAAGGSEGPQWYRFGLSPQSDFVYRAGRLDVSIRRGSFGVDLRNPAFDNPILGQTLAVAFGVACCVGVPAAASAQVLDGFEALPHRMERVPGPEGVTFINDSKATNLASMSAALDMCEGKVHLIAGGRLKEGNLECLKDKLGRRVQVAYLIGEAANQMEAAWGDAISIRQCGTLAAAVEAAAAAVQPGDVVLFSPGCASFDQFSGFANRGQIFRDAVSRVGELATIR